MKLRRQAYASSVSDYGGSLDESHLNKNPKEWLTRSSSTISSRSVVEHIDLPLSSSPMDYADSVTDRQLTGNRDIQMTSLKSACQVRAQMCVMHCLLRVWLES